MRKIPEVETAKALMTEATVWSVMKWLREKKRVRRTADDANAALDCLSQALKEQWTDDFRSAYQDLAAQSPGGSTQARSPKSAQSTREEAGLIVKKIKEADDEAYRARMDAEQTFDEAERQLSTRLAREGCRKAILSWELKEKAIQKAEALVPLK
jgi:hypothetical protein